MYHREIICERGEFLSENRHLRGRIEALRERDVEHKVCERISHSGGKTDASRDVIILAKDRRIKELETENRKLHQQLKVALGKMYDQL